MQTNQFLCGREFYRFIVLALLLSAFMPATSQQKQAIAGDYAGTLGPLHVRLHVRIDPAGVISGTVDSTDQGASFGIPCADLHLDGPSLSFSVPSVHGTWKGTATDDGLTGIWDQGTARPLYFARDAATSASKPSAVDGIWLGTLNIDNNPLRIQLRVMSDASGKEFCTVDSLDHRAMGLVCAKVLFASPSFSFDIPAVQGSWVGELSNNGNSLSGAWNQGSPLPLNLARQSYALYAAPKVTYDSALPPVPVADLKSVLDKDLANALTEGQLAPSTGTGVSIAVVQHGVRRVFSYGVAKPDSIFEIGSITKTFTGLVLSQLVEQGKVKLNDPVRGLLPTGTVAKPSGDEITLLDLATQHSGLPRMPDNFKPADPSNPYADYGPSSLYTFLAKWTLAKPVNPIFFYSNLGFGLLGHALAIHSGLSYSALLKQQVTDPLGLKDTTVSLTPEQQSRFLPGHEASHRPAHAWDQDVFAGAGAIRSTAPDMLNYLEANLHPEAIKAVVTSEPASTLAAALIQQHQLRADAGEMKIGLAWMFESHSGNYWHDGATGGYSAYAFFNPQTDCAAVVLVNTSVDRNSFADRLGEHIFERLTGMPVISLAD